MTRIRECTKRVDFVAMYVHRAGHVVLIIKRQYVKLHCAYRQLHYPHAILLIVHLMDVSRLFENEFIDVVVLHVARNYVLGLVGTTRYGLAAIHSLDSFVDG